MRPCDRRSIRRWSPSIHQNRRRAEPVPLPRELPSNAYKGTDSNFSEATLRKRKKQAPTDPVRRRGRGERGLDFRFPHKHPPRHFCTTFMHQPTTPATLSLCAVATYPRTKPQSSESSISCIPNGNSLRALTWLRRSQSRLFVPSMAHAVGR